MIRSIALLAAVASLAIVLPVRAQWGVVQAPNSKPPCVAAYKANPLIKFSGVAMIVPMRADTKMIVLRFGSSPVGIAMFGVHPATVMRAPSAVEVKAREVVLTGTELSRAVGTDRLGVIEASAPTFLVSNMTDTEIDMAGAEAAARDAAACSIQQPPPTTAATAMCSATLVQRMQARGLTPALIQELCQ